MEKIIGMWIGSLVVVIEKEEVLLVFIGGSWRFCFLICRGMGLGNSLWCEYLLLVIVLFVLRVIGKSRSREEVCEVEVRIVGSGGIGGWDELDFR